MRAMMKKNFWNQNARIVLCTFVPLLIDQSRLGYLMECWEDFFVHQSCFPIFPFFWTTMLLDTILKLKKPSVEGLYIFSSSMHKCELIMFLHQSFVQIYEILSQDFHGFSHRRLIWQTRLEKLLLERYGRKLNNCFTCEFLLASVAATLPETRKKEEK